MHQQPAQAPFFPNSRVKSRQRSGVSGTISMRFMVQANHDPGDSSGPADFPMALHRHPDTLRA
jgi:hypothetical protein